MKDAPLPPAQPAMPLPAPLQGKRVLGLILALTALREPEVPPKSKV
jgi:hypothetical protein